MVYPSPARKQSRISLLFAIVYLVVGALLIYLNFTGQIPGILLAIGMFLLIAASLGVRFLLDSKRRKNCNLGNARVF